MDRRKLVAVYIRDQQGRRFCVCVMAGSTHEAAREAACIFRSDWWRGPKPNAETVYEITAACGDDRRVWWVRDGVAISDGAPVRQCPTPVRRSASL